jgi:cobyric acid synthase
MTRDIRRNGKARAIMAQGTMSNTGKSRLATGLRRVFSKKGYMGLSASQLETNA